MSIPDSDTSIETTGYNSLTIERNSINLTEVTGESVQASAFRDAPNFGCCVIASGYDDVPLDLQAPHTSLVANQDVLAYTLSDIPHPQGSIPRAGNRNVGIRHLKAAYG